MKVWYKAAVNCALPPAQVTLDQITSERVDLYLHIQPLGGGIPISVKPFQVEDSVPAVDEIEGAVQRLRNNISRGPSGV